MPRFLLTDKSLDILPSNILYSKYVLKNPTYIYEKNLSYIKM